MGITEYIAKLGSLKDHRGEPWYIFDPVLSEQSSLAGFKKAITAPDSSVGHIVT